jgi:4-cresol dehydrogenase (hydroxylating)
MPQPEAYNSYVFEVKEERHLPQVMDGFRRLALQGVVTTKLHMINDFVSLTILTQRIHEHVSPNGPLSPAEIEALRRKYGVAPWSCAGGIYGTRGQVRLQRSLLRKALGPYGRLIFVSDGQLKLIETLIGWCRKSDLLRTITHKLSGTSLPVLESAPYVHKILQGIPTEYFVKHAYYRHRRPRPGEDVDPARDRCGLTWFAPILPFSHRTVLPYLDTCKRSFQEHGFDFYVAMLLMNPRSVICLMAIIYDKEDPAETARSEQLYDNLLTDMRAAQLQQYRAGLGSWRQVFEGTPTLRSLNERIKASVDPANILAPGRYGVGAKKELLRPGGIL